MTVQVSKTSNEWADFWRNDIGVNVIPATNKHDNPDLQKKPFWTDDNNNPHWIKWKQDGYQTKPISEKQHDEWKKNNAFKDGMAIICGQVWRGKQRGLWINGIDCDNKLGLDEVSNNDIKKMSQYTLVEQHGNKNKCHVLYYTNEPILSKGSNKNKDDNGNPLPQIEIKSEGNKLLYCAGGIHKDGSLIEIVGIDKVRTLDKRGLEERIDLILQKYSIPYLNGLTATSTSGEIKKLHDKTLKKTKGDGGGLDLLRVIDSWKIKNPEFSESMLIGLATEYTNDHHDPPCTEEKIKSLVKQGIKFGEEKLQERENQPMEIESKALELLQEHDKKEALVKLKEYCVVIGEKKGDTILKEIVKKATKKLQNNYSDEESTATIQAYNIGKKLIEKAVKSENDTEQIVIQVKIDGKPHWVDILSPTFNQMIRLGVQAQYYEIYTDSKYETAIKNLHAYQLFNCKNTKPIFNRCALVDGNLFYDLQDQDGTIYKITKDEIKEVQNDDNVPIFLKSPSAKTKASTQDKPLFDNDKALDEVVNLFRIQDKDKVIFISHLISYFLTDIPIPIAVFHGEQGSAKTSVSGGIKRLIDPEGECALSLQEKVDDLAVTLSRHNISNFDNTDNYSKDISQFLCKAVTGTQYAKRQLFSNGEEFSLTLKSKIILNGISPSIDQPDLLERSIFYELLSINKKERMTDKKFLNRLNELRPFVIGCIFKTIQKAMITFDEVEKELEGKLLPRMASFAVWGESISRSLGYEKNTFIENYFEKLDDSNLSLSEEYPIIEPLIDFMEGENEKEILVSVLFNRIVDQDKIKIDDRLPKDSKQLGKQLKQLSPTFRTLGFEVNTGYYNKRKGDYPRGSTIATITRIDEKGVDSFTN